MFRVKSGLLHAKHCLSSVRLQGGVTQKAVFMRFLLVMNEISALVCSLLVHGYFSCMKDWEFF
jgi:hypothetical protein